MPRSGRGGSSRGKRPREAETIAGRHLRQVYAQEPGDRLVPQPARRVEEPRFEHLTVCLRFVHRAVESVAERQHEDECVPAPREHRGKCAAAKRHAPVSYQQPGVAALPYPDRAVARPRFERVQRLLGHGPVALEAGFLAVALPVRGTFGDGYVVLTRPSHAEPICSASHAAHDLGDRERRGVDGRADRVVVRD